MAFHSAAVALDSPVSFIKDTSLASQCQRIAAPKNLDGRPRDETARRAGGVRMRCDAVGGAAAEEEVRVALAPRVVQRGAESRQFGACDDEEEEQQAHREQRHTWLYG